MRVNRDKDVNITELTIITRISIHDIRLDRL